MKWRKDHIITSVKGDEQPRRLVAAAVDTQVHGDPCEPSWQMETLTKWSACGWVREKDDTYREWSCSAADRDRWWRAVLWGAKRGGVTWLVSVRATRVASLLGIWEMVDNGTLQWEGGDSGSGIRGRDTSDVSEMLSGDGTRGPNERQTADDGMRDVHDLSTTRRGADASAPPGAARAACGLVIDDPPTILRLRVPGRPGRLWLCDARNWGLDVPPSFASASAEARWLADAMRRMVGELVVRGWGGLKATAGSQSLATWRRRYMTHQVVAHGDDEVLALEEAAYVGGRCECARLGTVDGPLVQIDRRSAYAHACAAWPVPVAVERRCDGDLSALLDRRDLAERCLAEVDLETDEPAYPRSEKGGTIYPVGRISTTLAGPELADAIRLGRVKMVGRAVLYHCEPALRAYALALWEARCDFERRGDKALEAWAKKLLVGLPGKLGQRQASWVSEPRMLARLPWSAWWGVDKERGVYRMRALSGAVQREERGGWTWDAVPAAACWILSAARMALLSAVRLAGWSECVYWDTDSLLVTATGFLSLTRSAGSMGDGLGQWRVVRHVDRAVIHGVKYYEHDDAIVCAGHPRADTEDTRLRGRYWYRQTFGMSLLEGVPPAAVKRLRTYLRAPAYTLGRVGDGGRVYPHVRDDWG